MRVVGRRKERAITYSAEAALLLEGARFNDEIHGLPGSKAICAPKGVYVFRTHEEADRQQEAWIVETIVRLARERAWQVPREFGSKQE